jgi:hypothetical protein
MLDGVLARVAQQQLQVNPDPARALSHEMSTTTSLAIIASPLRERVVQARDETSSYSIRKPEMARPMTSCWICSVPSKMSKILASRCMRSTGYSRV